jgi:hypothetical protein
MLGTFFKVIDEIFKDTYEKYKPYLVYILIIVLLILFYLINKKTFNEMYVNIINKFSNNNVNETFISKNMTPRILTNKKPIKKRRVQFNNQDKRKIFDYKEPPKVVSETNEIESMDNSWIVESKNKMINEESFIPDMMFPQNSNELIKQNKNVDTIDRPLKNIFSDMAGDIDTDVTDEQRKLIQGRDYKDYNTNVIAPDNLYTKYDQPHFNKQYNVGIKAFEGNSFGSLL